MKKMVFCHIGWMERYEGLSENGDTISGGGSFIDEHGYGHEIFNFKNIGGKVYGYVQPRGANDLTRLGANKDATYINDVLIVFTARHESGGTYIVGWHDNAKFYRNNQVNTLAEREFKGEHLDYYSVADAANTTLLSVDERFSFPAIPRGTEGMGQSNVWYADKPKGVDFKKEVLSQIEKHVEKKKQRIPPVFRQVDQEKKRLIEVTAINEVIKEYTLRNFTVTSVEQENLGWDLEAEYKNIKLLIEVKGLSSDEVSIELTPNEYRSLQKHQDTYRICVVTNCEKKPSVHVFLYSSELDKWISEDGYKLTIDEVVSARCYVKEETT
ncbi:MAG: DUF3883 domain-containing protein [Erysipelothrix sp.]|nr:DUF3883 domain-containing protein [Erysipelothrix sp.]